MNASPIAKRLKEARLKTSLSQAHLGVLAEIDELTASARMNQYERGSHAPTYQLLERCAEILNVPVEYFYAKSEKIAQLLVAVHRMREEQQERVNEFIQSLMQSDTESCDLNDD